MSAETWRVIDENGAEHAAIVETSEGKLVAVTIRRRFGYPCDTRVRAAIAREAWAADIAVAEILAPGQPSRAEVEADASRRGAEAMREVAARECDRFASACAAEGRLFGGANVMGVAVAEHRRASEAIRAIPLSEVEK